MQEPALDGIAVIGLAGRFPGAENVAEFWSNLVAVRDCVTRFTDEQLLALGVSAEDLADPAYVKAAPLVPLMEYFDAPLFGMSEREAQARDPQQRLFLETVHSALENAGCDPSSDRQRIGVYGGGATNRYADLNVRRNAAAVRTYGEVGIQTTNHTDYITTLASYKLGLDGPAMTVATACSTSLVAVHLACQAIAGGECDVAVAGGVEVEMPYGLGYRHVPGGIYSPDGLCRSYDAEAGGTTFGSGVGAVVLKRLVDAQADGDTVLAVLRGSAIGNDGSRKAGFTAPSVEGQLATVAEALAMADLDPATIGYVEGHGTATQLGDPIEVEALTRAFRRFTDASQYCVLGSVKSNIGHLGPAAGIAGLIKAVLAVRTGVIPGTVHYRSPNPRIDFADTPFRVTGETELWRGDGQPRRAGVSSFGIGGTNAHIVLEQAPEPQPAAAVDGPVLLTLSGRTPAALAAGAERLAAHLTDEDERLCDVAHTLLAGRRSLPHRTALTATDVDDAIARLTAIADGPQEGEPVRSERPVAFVFPGQGAQYPGMARELYTTQPVFAAALDHCLGVLRGELDADLHTLLIDAQPDDEQAELTLRQTAVAQPALFAVEWAMAELLASFGLAPSAVLGHSVGELVAATVAGIFEVDDALRLIAERGRLVQATEPGAMIAVPLGPDELGPWLAETELAVVNGPKACVLSGTVEAVERVETALAGLGHRSTRLRTSHAFHSRLVEPAGRELAEAVAGIGLGEPRIPLAANLTGTWMTGQEAADPDYWARQLRGTVRFADGVATLLADESLLLVEVGPGQSLTAQLRRLPEVRGARRTVLPLAPRRGQERDSVRVLLDAVGTMWEMGVPVDRYALDQAVLGGAGRKVALPEYPFERKRYWIDPDPAPLPVPAAPAPAVVAPAAAPAEDDRLTVPGWRLAAPAAGGTADRPAGRRWLLLSDGAAEADRLADALRARGASVTAAALTPGDGEAADPAALRTLIAAAAGEGGEALEVVACWLADPADEPACDLADRWQRADFTTLVHLVRAIGDTCLGRDVRLTALARGVWDVSGDDALVPVRATVTGLLSAAGKESETLTTRVVDAGASTRQAAVLAELADPDGPAQVALRGARRWLPAPVAVQEPDARPFADLVRAGGTYVVTGGLGALGLVAARELASVAPVRLALLGRRGLPPRERWADVLTDPASAPALVDAVRAVRDLEKGGSTVLALAADVADRDSMTAALRRVRDELGEVAGVVHSAGVAGGGILALKDPATARAVLAPKVTGTLLLDELCGDVDFFVLFSSVASVTGEFGLSDYAAANAFLDAFAHQRSRRGRTLAVNWPSWAEVGMAVDNSTSASAGFRSLQSGARGRRATAAARIHPLLHRRTESAGGVVEFRTELDQDMWPLDEHRIGGAAVLPGTAYLEIARAAALAARPGTTGTVEVGDLMFTTPIVVAGTREILVRLAPEGDGWRFEVTTTGEDGETVHASGTTRVAAVPAAPAVDVAALRARCAEQVETPAYDASEGLVFGGPRWRNVTAVHEGGGETLVDIELPGRYAADLEEFGLHPALLDGGTAFAVRTGDIRALPFNYRSVVVHGPLPSRFHAHVRPTGKDGRRMLVRDITLLAPDGRVLVEITGFGMRIVDAALVRSSTAAAASANGGAAAPAPAPARADRPRPVVDNALTTAEGARLLRALLGTDLGPQVVVTTEGLSRKLARAAGVTAAAVAGIAAPKPAPEAVAPQPAPAAAPAPVLAPAATASRTADELLALWREVLGDDVTTDDDFFDAGGDSLIAVQLISRIRNHLDTQLPISALFDHPTVTELATLIDQINTNATPTTPTPAPAPAPVPVPAAAPAPVLAPVPAAAPLTATIPSGVALLTRTSDDLLVLWREVLGDGVSAEDDFFDAGGDSLVAVQLISRVRTQMGTQLPISALFDHPTVTELAVLVDQLKEAQR